MVAVSNTATALRALQGVSAVAAMIFTSLGYIEYTSGQLSSGAAIFSTVANYTALLAAAYYVVALRWLRLSATAPRAAFQRAVDGAIAAALVLAGVLHATSDAKVDCTSQNILFATYHGRNLFRCGNMTFAIVLTFVTAGLFALTTVGGFVGASSAASATEASATAAGLTEPALSGADAYATVQTPGKPASGDMTSPATYAHRPALRAVRLGGRAAQFACSTAALVFTAAGYKHYYTGQYLSPKATYAILAAYTGALYALWHLVAVEHFKLSRRPALTVERVGDALLAFAQLVAGVVVATSAHIANCDEANDKFMVNHKATLFRCGSMNAGVVFAFLAVATFLVTVAASYTRGAVAENGRETTLTAVDASQA